MTTDDLIPFLVYIIVLSKPRNLRTNLFLMENLTFIGLSTNEMGYARASIHTTPHHTTPHIPFTHSHCHRHRHHHDHR